MSDKEREFEAFLLENINIRPQDFAKSNGRYKHNGIDSMYLIWKHQAAELKKLRDVMIEMDRRFRLNDWTNQTIAYLDEFRKALGETP